MLSKRTNLAVLDNLLQVKHENQILTMAILLMVLTCMGCPTMKRCNNMVCQRTAYELIKYAKGFLKHTLIEMDLVGMYLSL